MFRKNKINVLYQIILPIIISIPISIVTGIIIFTYQSNKEFKNEKEPILLINDFTKNADVKELESFSPIFSNQVFFNITARNAMIKRIIVNVTKRKYLDSIYRLTLDGYGGGFDTPICNIATIELDSLNNQYVLLDLNQGINNFNKSSLPPTVSFTQDLSNEFYLIYLNSSIPSCIYDISYSVEWTGLIYNKISTNEKSKLYKMIFIKPIEISHLISKNTKKVTFNNYQETETTLRYYLINLRREQYLNFNFNFTKAGIGKYIQIDDSLKLVPTKQNNDEMIPRYYKSDK